MSDDEIYQNESGDREASEQEGQVESMDTEHPSVDESSQEATTDGEAPPPYFGPTDLCTSSDLENLSIEDLTAMYAQQEETANSSEGNDPGDDLGRYPVVDPPFTRWPPRPRRRGGPASPGSAL